MNKLTADTFRSHQTLVFILDLSRSFGTSQIFIKKYFLGEFFILGGVWDGSPFAGFSFSDGGVETHRGGFYVRNRTLEGRQTASRKPG